MKQIAPLLFSLIFITAKAQFISNPNFLNSHLVPCPGDSTVMVSGFDEWKFYQTTNDLWDGPIDSTICINAENEYGNYGAYIALSELDTTRHLFIVSNYKSDGPLLWTNYVYNAWLQLYAWQGNFNVNPSWNCNGSPCSFLQVNVLIPDSTYTSTLIRSHVLSLDSTGYYSTNTIRCFPSEKFDTQRVTQIIAGLKFQNVGPNDTLDVSYEDAQNALGGVFNTTEINAYQVIDTEYAAYFYWGAYLMTYHDSTYPSLPHISYVNIYPGNNLQLTPQHISLYIEPDALFVYQPFTEVRGAPVNGMPGVYHNLTIIDNGGTLCLNMIGDHPFKDGDEFLFRSGMIEFGGILSCFIFHNGSTLRVDDGATLDYGSEDNFGVLSIREETNLEIGKNATLNIYNRMFIFEENPSEGPKQFYMTLNPTSTLRFMPGSHLYNLYSVDNTIKLNVYMKGGVLDDASLPEEDRARINRIYEPDDLPAKIMVYPSPADNVATVRINSPEDEDATVILNNAAGSKYNEKKIHLQKGINEFSFSLDGMSSGIYFLKVKYSDGSNEAVGNIVKGN